MTQIHRRFGTDHVRSLWRASQKIFLDLERRDASGKLTRDQAPVEIDIDVTGVEYLLLMIDGNWSEAEVMAGGRSPSRQ